MKKCTPLVAVKDMEKSKRFYKEILGQDVIVDYGENVLLTSGFALQTIETWKNFIQTDDVTFKSNSFELVFEEDDFDGFLKGLKRRRVEKRQGSVQPNVQPSASEVENV